MKTKNRQNLVQMLTEMHDWHRDQAVKIARDTNDPREYCELGKHDGAVETIGAILLQILGGRKYAEFLAAHTGLDIVHESTKIVPFRQKGTDE